MNRLFLKPSRPGLIVRDPRSKLPLPEAGAHKPDNSYWRRRMRSGDAIEVAPPAAVPVAPAPARPTRAEGNP